MDVSNLSTGLLITMDFVERFAGRTGGSFNPDAIFKFTPLSPAVQQHLSKVLSLPQSLATFLLAAPQLLCLLTSNFLLSWLDTW